MATMDLGPGSLAGLARLRNFERHRLSSYDRSGGNLDALRIEPGSTAQLGEVAGPGCVRHIWMTLTTLPADPHELVANVFRVFWDGEASPSVEVPVGDFFGLGFGRRRPFVSLPLQAGPEDGKAMSCWFPMPFAEGARFEVENQGQGVTILFYYIDYEAHPPDSADPELARFHAWWNRVPETFGLAERRGYTREDYRLDRRRPVGAGLGFGAPWSEPNLDAAHNYVLLDVHGDGQYVGCVLNVDVFERQVNDWYGEGDDMIFVDGEAWPPRLHGTGTEDYFDTAFCPTRTFWAPYHGISLYSGNPAWPWGGKNSLYRFHVEDPIRFRRSIRVTFETGHANALRNDYSSTAYWYQRGRTEPLPPLPPLRARIPRPDPPELAR